MPASTALLTPRRDPPLGREAHSLFSEGAVDVWLPQVGDALGFLPELYPGGDLWLSRKIADIRKERSRCLVAVAVAQQVLAGVAIETFKSPGVVKLSTFYVETDSRRKGVGTAMLERLTGRWRVEGVRHAYVTVASTKAEELEPLLLRHDFVCRTVHEGRYGMGRNEHVFDWRPFPR